MKKVEAGKDKITKVNRENGLREAEPLKRIHVIDH